MEPDYTIVGGGVVGLAVAYGLVCRGKRVRVLDQGDDALRASRGNFGLVWVQGKGLNAPAYARWTRRSAVLWRAFAAEIADETGTDLALRQDGGFDFHLDEQSLATRTERLTGLRDALGGDYPFEVLGNSALRKEEPQIGPEVAGAILHHEDGHVNPLRLLRALADRARSAGARLCTGTSALSIGPQDGGFRIATQSGEMFGTARIVLCAGLGAAQIGPQLGFKAPVQPQRGQVMITERLAPLIRRPSAIIRQVDEGGVQIGDSHEDVGLDDRESVAVGAANAHRAIRVFPALARAKVVRHWGALRVLSPDGLPIYQQSRTVPGAFLVTCHSGITLAAAHARLLPLWLEGSQDAPDLSAFSEDRFVV